MISRRHKTLRLVETSAFLHRLESVDRIQLAGVLNSSLVYWVLIFSAPDSGLHAYLEVGPGCSNKTIDEGVARCPTGFVPRIVVPARACPSGRTEFLNDGAREPKLEFARLVPLRDLANVPANAPVEAPTVLGAPTGDPADALRRALHGVLSAITDREVSLSVRESGSVDHERHFNERERNLEELTRRVTARDAELKVLRRALDHRERELSSREQALAELDTELKTRKNSVYFREKSLAARESELEARVLDVNAREGALVTAEKSMAVREKMIAARERRHTEVETAFAAERIRVDTEIRAVQAELVVREDFASAREKSLESREATIKAETIAMLQALESITNASRSSATPR